MQKFLRRAVLAGVIAVAATATVPLAQASAATACATAWSATAVYVKDNSASQSGHNYTAKWWTQNEDPLTASCQYCAWQLVGPCAGARMANPGSSPTLAVFPNPVLTSNLLTVDLGETYERVELVLTGINGGRAIVNRTKAVQTAAFWIGRAHPATSAVTIDGAESERRTLSSIFQRPMAGTPPRGR